MPRRWPRGRPSDRALAGGRRAAGRGEAGPVTAGDRGTATCASRAVGGGRREVDGGRAGGGPAGRPTRRRAGGCLGARFLREREPRPDSTAPASRLGTFRRLPPPRSEPRLRAWGADHTAPGARRLASLSPADASRRLPPRPAEAACAQVAGCSRRHDAARPGRSLETQFSPLCSFRNR